MRKTLKGLAISLAAICVLLIMAVPAFATANGRGSASYVVSDRTIPAYATTDTISVKLVIQGRGYTPNSTTAMSEIYDVSLTGQTSYTVSDVLLASNNNSSHVQACNSSGNPITSSSDSVYQFVSGTGNVGPIFYANHGEGYRVLCDGWVFRINGQYPLLSTTGENGFPKGTGIKQTPVANGDVVYFYFNHPWKESNTNWSTKFVAADAEYVNGKLKVQLQWSDDFHTNKPYKWKITDYSYQDSNNVWIKNNFTAFNTSQTTVSGTLYDQSGNSVTNFTFDTSTGYGEETVSLSSGIYYLKCTWSKKQINRTGYIYATGSTTATYSLLDSTMTYDQIIIN